MQVQRLVVIFNDYDWVFEGTPPHTFGGSVWLKLDQGELKVNLQPDIVTAILTLVAGGVARSVDSMANEVTEDVVANAPVLFLERNNG